jgi:hypothetical protein
MSINRTIVHLWTGELELKNGQRVERLVRAKTIKAARIILDDDANVRRILKVKKHKI